MGDRTWMQMTFRKADGAAVEEVLGGWDMVNDDTDDALCVHFDEVNYGGQEYRETLAKRGIVFTGGHGEGGDYGAYVFAAVDGEMRECPASHEGDPFVVVDEDGTPNRGGLQRARDYLAHEKRAQERLKGG